MNQTEFEATVAKLRPRLRRMAAKIVGHDEADDVVQLTLANAWRDRRSIKSLDAYLRTQIADDARDYLASTRRHPSIETYVRNESLRPTPVDEDSMVTRLAVRAALRALPEDIRAAVWAVFAEGVSWREAADEAGVEHTVLFRRVQKWLPYLREQLGATEPPSSPAMGWETEAARND